jgi:FMN phosphatase YigB (HAD superfamily)
MINTIYNSERLVLVDADGVLLEWTEMFYEYMETHGYTVKPGPKHSYILDSHFEEITYNEVKQHVKTFNESAAIGFLHPFRDSIHYVKKLYEEHGYKFRVITSLSNNVYAGQLRELNLRKLFGDAIESVICLETGADKDEVLKPYQYSNMFWIEDKFENYKAGLDLGLNALLVEHDHNKNKHPEVDPNTVVKSWKEIYEIITNCN